MASPANDTARLFRRAAAARREEAGVLLDAGYGSGAVYLGGYGVECVLKALLISATPRGRRAGVVRSFRGTAGHNLNGLRTRYIAAGGAWPPRPVADALNRTERWETGLRYSTAAIPVSRAAGFLSDADLIADWADGRL